ncbi:sulfatase [Pelagicoccus sp. SDUM812005]|uniref:sulfatase family protein n=1 Tax=Pelagicoccus sp. SDUM812005 TaxID=3041257 RepID=UPI00280D623A|nr:sulfatase [Pelagicoccus sp. SDUM812005]MDQ8180333.1 sulfatase [Pelagicoccus sp. SDUM812005]
MKMNVSENWGLETKGWLLTFLFVFLVDASTINASGKPNVLFIMSDDHTSQAVGAYGSRLAKLNPTPTLDALAEEGVVMLNAFCQNAICTPSRASIMTGQSSATNGVPTLWEGLPPERQYLALEMKKAGYQTAVIGKWHLKKLPLAFDYYKVLDGQGDYFDPIFYETGAKETQSRYYNKWGREWTQEFEGAVMMKGHSSDCIADSALEWFREKRDPNKPFFLKLHFKAPHDYFEYAPRYESYLAGVEIPEPENMWDRKNNGSLATRGVDDSLAPYIGTSVGGRNLRRNYVNDEETPWAGRIDPSLSEVEQKRQAYQLYLKAYLRCVKGVDDNLARVFAYLKEEGLLDNTVVVYTGDQGFYLGEHDYIDKRWAYEESMRMPLIIRYPDTVKKGARIDSIVENVDFAPTLLDFAGVDTPVYMQGASFREILETGREPTDWKQAAYYHYWMHMKHHDNPAHIAIRTKRYKLILFYGTGWQGETEPTTPPAWELYDLKLDPSEDRNVYGNPEYKEVVACLKEQLRELRSKYGENDSKFAFNKAIEAFWDYDENARLQAIEISVDLLNAYENGKAVH